MKSPERGAGGKANFAKRNSKYTLASGSNWSSVSEREGKNLQQL